MIDICGNFDCEDTKRFGKNIALRAWSHWCLKTIGIISFTALFFIIYFYLLTHSFFTITIIPFSVVDEIIGFQPQFLPFYLSLWVYVSLVPALMRSRRELFYYGGYIGSLCLAGIAFYIVFPTTLPPITIDWSQYPDFTFLKSVDAAGNAFPSMHVATALFSYFWLDRLLDQMGSPRWIKLVSALWCLGIVFSTMAIKQHLFLDVVGGVVLGGIAAFLTLREYSKRFKS